MSYKRISVRFNMDVEDERNAWESLHKKGAGVIGKEIINAINASSDISRLENMIRKVVAEELQKIALLSSELAIPTRETEEAEDSILDFLDSF